MIFTYYAIFREANRQEKQLAARQGNAMLMHRHSSAGGTNGTYGKQNDKSMLIHKNRNGFFLRVVLCVDFTHFTVHHRDFCFGPMYIFLCLQVYKCFKASMNVTI